MRRLVVGDIHGAYKALQQVLKRSSFDYQNDQLIVIGDVVDRWPETKQCVDELLKIKNLIFILGNHDLWCREWMRSGEKEYIWISQGGKETIQSYQQDWIGPSIRPSVPEAHGSFFENGKAYYLTEDNKLFVHGGFDINSPVEQQHVMDLTWDRSLFERAQKIQETSIEKHPQLSTYSEIYIGHTSTERFSLTPVRCCEVWNVDQGAGWGGKLTLMDIDSKEFWSSDLVKDLYGDSV